MHNIDNTGARWGLMDFQINTEYTDVPQNHKRFRKLTFTLVNVKKSLILFFVELLTTAKTDIKWIWYNRYDSSKKKNEEVNWHNARFTLQYELFQFLALTPVTQNTCANSPCLYISSVKLWTWTSQRIKHIKWELT